MKKPIPSTTPRLRVAAYCRLTAREDEQNTLLEAQKAQYTERISANPDWIMAGVFADTGDFRSKRPAFQKMLRKCRQKKIDLILVRSISRFSRSGADCLAIVRELRDLGIAVEFEMENINTLDPNSDWYISMIETIAKAERASISSQICNGRFPSLIKSRHTKGTWKKTIRLPGRPGKTIIFRTE